MCRDDDENLTVNRNNGMKAKPLLMTFFANSMVSISWKAQRCTRNEDIL